jgi:hypothetical protein
MLREAGHPIPAKVPGSREYRRATGAGFHISGFTGVAFASLAPPGVNFSLYTINLATGAATLIGAIDGGSLVTRDISVSNVVIGVPLPGSLTLLGMGAAALVVTVVRSRRTRSGAIG